MTLQRHEPAGWTPQGTSKVEQELDETSSGHQDSGHQVKSWYWQRRHVEATAVWPSRCDDRMRDDMLRCTTVDGVAL